MLRIKIVTVNVPESYIGAINKLIGENGLYPSRSELIRVAVREFLLRALKMANNMAKYDKSEEEAEEDFDEENFVKIPIENVNENSEPIREYKTYKIIKSLDHLHSKGPKESEFTGEANCVGTYDDTPLPSNYDTPTREELRNSYPNEPDFKYINERLI